MKEKWKAVLRAAAPVLALLVLALGVRLLPSALGNADQGADPSPVVRPGRNGGKPQRPKKPLSVPIAPVRVTPETQHALQKMVTAQLAAFARNDFAAALHFAAPEMRHSWSPEAFRQMVQSGFSPLLTYRRASFAPARLAGEAVMMPVVITDVNGSNAAYLYLFHRKRPDDAAAPKSVAPRPDEWYIDGVSPLPPSDGDGMGSDPMFSPQSDNGGQKPPLLRDSQEA